MTSPKLAVCLRVHQKKVSGVRQVSLYALSLIVYLSHGAPPALSSIRNTSPLHPDLFPLVFWRKVERGGAAVEGNVEGEGGGVISSVYGVVSQRHPVAPTCSSLTSPHGRAALQSEGKADQEVGSCVVGEAGGWLCQSPVFSSQGQGRPPPPSPLLFRTLWEETESMVRKNKKVGPLLRRLCGWTALGRAGGKTGAAAAWWGATGPATCGPAFQTF